MRSIGPIRCPTCAGSPLTDTRPARISSSMSRREPIPDSARTLCNLGESSSGSGRMCRGNRRLGSPASRPTAACTGQLGIRSSSGTSRSGRGVRGPRPRLRPGGPPGANSAPASNPPGCPSCAASPSCEICPSSAPWLSCPSWPAGSPDCPEPVDSAAPNLSPSTPKAGGAPAPCL